MNFKQLDIERKVALSRQDAHNYFRLCNELGIEPEDKFLYNQLNTMEDKE